VTTPAVADPTTRSLRTALGWKAPSLRATAVILLVAALLPIASPNDYLLHTLVIAFTYMMVNQAWNLLLGVAGIWSFAQITIFAIGGYSSGLLALHLGLSPWLAMPIAGLVGMVVGVLLGIPAFRVTGIYVALLTFAFNEVVRLLIVTDERGGLTGGAFGLGGLPPFFDPSAGMAPPYWLALGLLVLVSLVVYRVMHSPLGLAFGALRESRRYAIGRGIDPFRYQLLVFGISSFLTAVAGAFYAHYLSIIQPQIMGLALSTNLVAMIIVGGLGTFVGPIIGTAALVFLTEVLREAEQLRLILLGIILLVIIVAMPDGLAGGLGRIRARIGRWIEEGDRREDEPGAGDPSSEAIDPEVPPDSPAAHPSTGDASPEAPSPTTSREDR
jgi:branched-chain amino acid transport system permease protein